MKRTIRAMIPLAILLAGLDPVIAQTAQDLTPLDSTGKPIWAKGSAAETGRLSKFLEGLLPSADGTTGESQPGSTEQTFETRNSYGRAGTYLAEGPVASTATLPFFMSLGTNDRTCLTCHQPSAGWSITPRNIQALFHANPGAPLFRPIDGAVCPTADTSTTQAAANAYTLLINKGLIRVFIPMPSADILQFSITNVSDPYNCTSNPATGLTSPTTGFVSEYRRPGPTANLPFLTDIMWDGREPSLESQARDAVMIHGQGTEVPDDSRLSQIASFESELFAAQTKDNAAGDLTSNGGQGGPIVLSTIPVVANINPPGPGFDATVMNMFLDWSNSSDPSKASIARGQTIFNERSFAITDVNGLNDVAGKPSIPGTCSACHNTPQIGDHSSPERLDMGVTAALASVPGTTLSIADLPVFTVHCDSGPLAGTERQVTDLGRGLITGQCADIGKVKTALLRNLAARPPYFHNGSAADLPAVVQFYNNRFNIGLSDQDQADLVAFLATL